MKITWHLPLELVNTANRREDRWTRAKRNKEQRGLACAQTNTRMPFDSKIPNAPYEILITRIGPRELDSDGAIISAKPIRDGIADALGINDGDKKAATWAYAQKKGEYGVEVLIEWKG